MRSSIIKKELEKKYDSIDVVVGQNTEEREKAFEVIKRKNNDYDFCYIESKVGVTRYKDTKILYSLKSLKIKRIGIYYRDMYWAYKIKTSEGKFKNLMIPTINSWYLKLLDKICDVIFVQSDSFKYELLKFIPNSKVLLLPPGCDNIKVLDVHNHSILYVGEVDNRFSGIDLLLDTLKYINNEHDKVTLNIVCREEEFISNKTLLEIANSYTWINIYHNTKKNIDEIYNISSIAVIPRSGDEYTKLCLPIKLFEYISFEKPIIAIDHGEVGEFIRNNQIGLTANGNKEEFAKQIIDLLDNADSYAFYKEQISLYKEKNLWSNRIEFIETSLTNRIIGE